MLWYLGFDARQSLVAVPLELKSLSFLFKPRDIINILVFLGPNCKLRTAFFVRIYGPSAKAKKLGPQLTERLSNSDQWEVWFGECVMFLFLIKRCYIFPHTMIYTFFSFFHVSFLHNNLRTLSKSRGPLYVMFHAPFVMSIVFFVKINFTYEFFVSRTFPWYVSSLVF